MPCGYPWLFLAFPLAHHVTRRMRSRLLAFKIGQNNCKHTKQKSPCDICAVALVMTSALRAADVANAIVYRPQHGQVACVVRRRCSRPLSINRVQNAAGGRGPQACCLPYIDIQYSSRSALRLVDSTDTGRQRPSS